MILEDPTPISLERDTEVHNVINTEDSIEELIYLLENSLSNKENSKCNSLIDDELSILFSDLSTLNHTEIKTRDKNTNKRFKIDL